MPILADSQTPVLVQGITGREAASLTLECIRSGTRIVAGVTPGKGGQKIHGVPVFNTVSEAHAATQCTATVISVPVVQVKAAATDALQSGIKLLVILTERIPRRDVVNILELARIHAATVIGPNSLGIVSPAEVRIGMAGGTAEALTRAYRKGQVGILSRSGGMLTEIANVLTMAGIGQSTCISIGGDPIVGSTFLDLLPLYEADPQTMALVLFCEPGSSMEEQLAERLSRSGSRLPIVAFVAGRFTDRMQSIRFGHAGAMVEGLHGSPAQKIACLHNAGAIVADRISEIPKILRRLLGRTN
jgi:succinyl-CoA synthetase alpha subunit